MARPLNRFIPGDLRLREVGNTRLPLSFRGSRSFLLPGGVGATALTATAGAPAPTTAQQATQQDVEFLNTIYGTGVPTQLAQERERLRTAVTPLLTESASRLAGQRGRFGEQFTSLIGGQEAALTGARGRFGETMRAALEREAAEEEAGLARLETAETAAAQQDIAKGIRGAKALFSRTGYGGGTYGQRLLAGLTAGPLAEARRRIEERRFAGKSARAQRAAALEAGLSDRERADLLAIYGDRSRLIEALGGMERGETERDIAARLRLEESLAGAGREDLRYILGERGRFLGARAPLLAGLEAEQERERTTMRRRGTRPVYSNYF